MQQRIMADRGSSLSELLGTYLQLSAQFAPPAYSLHNVANAVNELDALAAKRSINIKDGLVNSAESFKNEKI